MADVAEPNNTLLVDRWRAGDENAATALYERFAERLLNLISENIAQKHRSHADPEDVLQSTFRSWFTQTRKRSFEFEADVDVWKLLLTMALNKVRDRVRASQAQKRDVRLTCGFSDELAAVLANPPSQQDESLFRDLLQDLLNGLDHDEQEVVRLKLEGYKMEEIAERLGCSPRSIHRILRERVLRRMMALLIDGDTAAGEFG